jgi:dTDP-glucose pyrophosphorylase
MKGYIIIKIIGNTIRQKESLMRLVKKGIVLAAGKGTRLMPLTLAMPKEMIRVGVKPVIEYAVEILKAGGIKEILVIVGRKKESIMDYLGSGERFGVDIYYRIQEEPKGSAHAVYYARDFVGAEDFVVIYGDNYFKPYKIIKDVINVHVNEKADATLLLHPVKKNPSRFGIVKINERNEILNIIEKPPLEKAKFYRTDGAYLTIAGLLVLRKTIFESIEKIKPGANGEIWLTDAVERMRKHGYRIYGYSFRGARYDIGTFESLKEADKIEQESYNVQLEDNRNG